jgi:hypothetical protein
MGNGEEQSALVVPGHFNQDNCGGGQRGVDRWRREWESEAECFEIRFARCHHLELVQGKGRTTWVV